MTKKSDALLITWMDLNWDIYCDIIDSIVEIDRDNLMYELERQAARYAHYNGLLQVAKRELDRSKNELEQFIAKVRKEEFDSRTSKGLKVTDKYLESFVSSHPEFHTLQEKVNELTFKTGLVKSIAQALEQRKDTIVQLSVWESLLK